MVLVAGICFGSVYLACYVQHEASIPTNDASLFGGDVENVILMIGDGMGETHIAATAAYLGLDNLFMQTAPMTGYVATSSLAVTSPTDSAAAATALSTGVKTNNGKVGRDSSDKDLQNMCEYAKSLGKGVGIVVTETLTGATPAGFTAHASSRSDTAAIRASQLASGADLLIGAAADAWSEHKDEVTAAGYTYCDEYTELTVAANKLFAAFTEISTSGGTNAAPELSDLVNFAVTYLSSKYPDGFFLMVEGSHIDKRSHANDFVGMTAQLSGFDNAVRAAAKEAELRGDTAVIVTADHETGDLIYCAGDKFGNGLFHSVGHTSKNVRYFVFGKVSKLPGLIDNTEVSLLCRKLLAA